MTPAEIVAGAFRGLEYAGLLGFVGVVVMRQLARQPPHLGWVRPGMDGALALALLGGVATVALAPSWIGAARVAVELAALVMCLRWVRAPPRPGSRRSCSLRSQGTRPGGSR